MTILQPNLTFWEAGTHQPSGFQVQSENWIYQADACGRPPAEVQQSVICATCFTGTASSSASPYLTGSAGGDFDLFSPCCPYSGTVTGAVNNTIYYTARNCTNNYCITSDVGLANRWDQCVQNKALDFRQSNLTGNTSGDGGGQEIAEGYCGRCEYLNHDFLRKGLVKGSSNRAGNSAVGPGVVATILLSLAVTAFSC